MGTTTSRPGAPVREAAETGRPFASGLARLAGLSPSLGAALLAGVLLIVPALAQPGFTKIFIDDILGPGRRDWLRPLLAAMAASLLAIGALATLQRRTYLRQVLRSTIAGNARFVSRALRLPYSFFTRLHGGEVGMRGKSIETVSRILVEDSTSAAISLLGIALFALLMLQYDAALTLVAVGVALLSLAAAKVGAKRGKVLLARFVAEYWKAWAVGLQGLQNIEQVKASGWEHEFFTHLAGVKARGQNIGQRYSLWMLGLGRVPILLTDLLVAAVLGLGALRVMEGSMSIGALAAFLVLVVAFLAPVQQLVTSSANLLSLGAYVGGIEEVTEHPPDPLFAQGREDRFVLPGVGVRLSGDFELRDVTFGFTKGEPPLIRNFSLKVAPGSRVALVGASGSGKSTVVRLIAQLYRPWSGEILFDSIPREEIPQAVFANSVSFVDQEVFLFEGSVRENVTMWNPTIPESDLVQATRDAEIHEVVARRPGGTASRVLTAGANFSGGQRQRLEIARALATNPSIVILDEATSALDSETEERVDASLRRRGATCLIVAHRLSTIRDADEIIVMDQGCIVERGTHEELMSGGGRYARLLVS